MFRSRYVASSAENKAEISAWPGDSMENGPRAFLSLRPSYNALRKGVVAISGGGTHIEIRLVSLRPVLIWKEGGIESFCFAAMPAALRRTTNS